MILLVELAGLVAAVGTILPTPLEEPPFVYTPAAGAPGDPGASIPGLELIQSSPNGVSDYAEWFDQFSDWPSLTFHGGGSNESIRGTRAPNGVPLVLHAPGNTRFQLYEFISGSEADIAIYGDPPNRYGVVLYPRLLALYLDPADRLPTQVLDFLAYMHGPEDVEEDLDFTFQQLRWAEVRDGVLYVSNAHRTYAESSGGLNAYITALDPETFEILWRSEPLVSNSENFVIVDDAIVTGYGFTDEDDFIIVLDRRTGEVVRRLEAPSAPQYFHVVGNNLFVRCYDTDLVYEIR